MVARIFVAMAYSVGNYDQSDYLYLIKLNDGSLVGCSPEFECCTRDIEAACSPEMYGAAKWFGLPAEVKGQWTPAALSEIRAQGLEKHLIGSKADLRGATPIEPIDQHG